MFLLQDNSAFLQQFECFLCYCVHVGESLPRSASFVPAVHHIFHSSSSSGLVLSPSFSTPHTRIRTQKKNLSQPISERDGFEIRTQKRGGGGDRELGRKETEDGLPGISPLWGRQTGGPPFISAEAARNENSLEEEIQGAPIPHPLPFPLFRCIV